MVSVGAGAGGVWFGTFAAVDFGSGEICAGNTGAERFCGAFSASAPDRIGSRQHATTYRHSRERGLRFTSA
ncbi:hypothetical protein [Lysobacter gummosus]|uniref:hypothetical protein n=1 Tax=Lysobacter gummosus TaxID=262324 RepID=UPI00363AAB85